jgi:hypothetical protein
VDGGHLLDDADEERNGVLGEAFAGVPGF